MSANAQRWTEYSTERLVRLCRLRRYCDSLADDTTKRLLQRAIFSVYLDCVDAGVPWQAREILAEWTPGSCRAPAAEAAAR